MKTTMKKVCLYLLVTMVVILFTSIQFIRGEGILKAEAASTYENEYYYQQLGGNTRAKKFYSALDQMNTNGTFKTGNGKFDLIQNKIISEADVTQYGKGDASLLQDFGAGKDAYYLDHPEIFYINFDLLTLSMATQNGKVIASIDAGRTNSYYAEGFSSSSQIDTAIQEVNQKFNELDLTKCSTIKEKIEKINQTIMNQTQYGFTGSNGLADAHIRSIYGYAHYGLCVCEGYSRTFQYYCDINNIPCEEIVGNLIDGESLEPHAWNYVRLENGVWYAVDSTVNDSMNKENAYLLLGEQSFISDHIESGIISQSNFNFKYPALAQFDYGKETLQPIVTFDDTERTMTIKIGYNNLNATKLQKDNNLYLVLYAASGYDENNNIIWGIPSWLGAEAYESCQKDGYVETLPYTEAWPAVKFVITDQAPDNTMLGSYMNGIQNVITESNVIENIYYAGRKTDTTVKKIELKDLNNQQTYNNSAILPAEHSYEIIIEYDMDLKVTDSSKDISINIVSNKGENLNKYVKVEDLQFDNKNEITFKFTPSQMYQHNCVTYNFNLVNILTKETNVAPRVADAIFARKSAACSKVFNDGRLWMDVYGNPTLVDNSDLSMNGWEYQDKNGQTKKVAQNQRSQLALVVTKPIPEVENNMVDGVQNVEKEILASQTYDLGIDICGCIAKIPSGSYLKLSFGFPEGYSYNSKDEGVTFKVYHFKTKPNGELDYEHPELLNCVITEYGIIIETNNFSPFMLVAVKDEGTKTKSVYARPINAFGTVKSSTSTALTAIDTGTVEYTITPNEHYQIDYILLNGKDVKDRVVNGKIILSYDELGASNTLDVSFVQEDVAKYEQENGIESLNESFSTQQSIPTEQSKPTPGEADNPNTPTIPDETDNQDNSTIVPIIIAVVAVLLLAIAVVIVIILIKKRKSTN